MVLVVLLAMLSSLTQAADRFWVGPDGGSWSNAANWSTIRGGSGGAGAPRNSDRAFIRTAPARTIIFDGNYLAPGLNYVGIQSTGSTPLTFIQTANDLVSFNEDVGDVG